MAVNFTGALVGTAKTNSNRWALSPLTPRKVKSICDMIRALCLSKIYHTIPFKIVCCNERFSYSSIYRAADMYR